MTEALACAEAGADWIGLNFHPASPRCVDEETAAEIMAALPLSCSPVGLFVDRPPSLIAELTGRLGMRIVQLHGSEPPEDLLTLDHLTLLRAFRIADAAAISSMCAYLDRSIALGRAPDHVLIDGYASGQHGGTGQAITDELLERLPPLPRLVLAGGLTPENVAERISRVRPWMVDVASGVESSPGRKDPEKVAAFIKAAKGARRA